MCAVRKLGLQYDHSFYVGPTGAWTMRLSWSVATHHDGGTTQQPNGYLYSLSDPSTTASHAGGWNAFGTIPIGHLFDALGVEEPGDRDMVSGSRLEPITAM